MYPNRKKRNAFCWQFQWYAWEFTCFPRRKISVLYRFLYAKFHEFSFHKHDLCFFRNSSKNTIEISLRKSSFGFCYYSRCLCYINRHATREIDSTHTHTHTLQKVVSHITTFSRESISCLGES